MYWVIHLRMGKVLVIQPASVIVFGFSGSLNFWISRRRMSGLNASFSSSFAPLAASSSDCVGFGPSWSIMLIAWSCTSSSVSSTVILSVSRPFRVRFRRSAFSSSRTWSSRVASGIASPVETLTTSLPAGTRSEAPRPTISASSPIASVACSPAASRVRRLVRLAVL